LKSLCPTFVLEADDLSLISYLGHNLEDITCLISSNEATLRDLHLVGSYVGQLSVRTFNELTSLSIRIPIGTEFNGLELIFRHAYCLESLAVVGFFDSDVFSVLSTYTSALPLLQSFRLSSHAMAHGACFAVSKFLRGRTALRRVAVEVEQFWHILVTMLPMIAPLPALEVLSLSAFATPAGDGEYITTLARNLPLTLRALKLYLLCDSDGQFDQTLVPLVSRDNLGQCDAIG
jgi:hypothetical protein